jgi:hypothetical protein
LQVAAHGVHQLRVGGGDRFADLVATGGVPADVQEAGDRRGPGLDHAGLEVAGGASDADAIHIGERAQGGRFVGYPVLQAHDRSLRRDDIRQLKEGGNGVLALDRHEDDAIGNPSRLGYHQLRDFHVHGVAVAGANAFANKGSGRSATASDART